MSKFFKNVLIIKKKSKLNYLIDKYGIDSLSNSIEYPMLKKSMESHNKNCDSFISSLFKAKHTLQNIHIVEDNFLNNETIEKELTKSEFDVVFSLGGDGTFLRSAHYINDYEKTLIGVNTDNKNSVGFYCSLNSNEACENDIEKLKRILSNETECKILDKIEIETNKNKVYFLNDLYYGEKFMGRISKYNLSIDNLKSEIIKSSGIILSTYLGYSGWIRNANTISFPKFANLINEIGDMDYNTTKLIDVYSNNILQTHLDNKNSIFYFVREPNLKPNKSKENNSAIDKYLDYLNFMEGCARNITIQNFCYEGILILDGSFTIPIDYNQTIKISIGNKQIKVI